MNTPAVLFLTLFAGTAVGQTPPQKDQDPPNIIVLVSDDHRWDGLGAAGNKVIQTPRLDQLSGEGIRFTRAYVTTSICMVSRASILTGQYMSRHHITQFGIELEPEAFAQTYSGVLREAGYWTGFIGKYGIGQVRDDDFDFVRSYSGRHWLENGEGNPIHITEQNALDALDFVRERPGDKPFLLSVSFFAPHAEDSAPQQYLPQDWSAGHYQDVTVPGSTLMDEQYFEALPEFIRQESNEGRIRYHWRFDTPERYQEYMINYFRLITEVDEAVGRLVDELRQQGIYDNTLIVFIGDNGYFQADRGLADKWYPYEESIRVPLIVHDPRLPAAERGITRDEMVLNIDLAPMIVAAAGLEVPGGMQGRDPAPLYLSGAAHGWRDEFFYEHPTITDKNRIPSSQAVVRRDLKYVHWPEWDYQQLFDLRRDPGERQNLIGEPDYRQQQQRMEEKFRQWRQRVR
ncbi:MAG: sulfatase [Balneolales bacterium]